MKNLFLSVILLLTVSFAFANNEVEKVSTFDIEETLELTNSVELANTDFTAENYSVVKVVGTCVITIGFYDADGNKIYELTLIIEGVGSAEECNEIANNL